MALIFTAVLRFLCSVERRGGGGGGGGGGEESFYLISPAVQNLDGQIQQSFCNWASETSAVSDLFGKKNKKREDAQFSR